jgi:hypothetical protein
VLAGISAAGRNYHADVDLEVPMTNQTSAIKTCKCDQDLHWLNPKCSVHGYKTSADDVARETVAEFAGYFSSPARAIAIRKANQLIAAVLKAERALVIEECVAVADAEFQRNTKEAGRFDAVDASVYTHRADEAYNIADKLRAMASAGTARDACCDNEDRTMDGGCRNCGDPSF